MTQRLGYGYVETFYYDCEWVEKNPSPMIDTGACKLVENNYAPTFLLVIPPYARVNPYDGSETYPTIVKFPVPAVDAPTMKKWILDSVPDYSRRLATQTDLYDFQSTHAGKIAKVYLLSTKSQTPQLYGALSATYRDRIHFAFIYDDGASAPTGLKQAFNIEQAPTLLLEKVDGSTEVYSGTMKLPELIAWL